MSDLAILAGESDQSPRVGGGETTGAVSGHGSRRVGSRRTNSNPARSERRVMARACSDASPDGSRMVELWRSAAASPAVDAVIRAIHLEVAESTRTARPLCLASGRCCNFAAFGHRLFVTGLETAWCLREIGREPTNESVDDAARRGTCPFLVDGLCSVHAVRPFACRTFFCDRDATEWQRRLHERCHDAMREVHDAHAIPYRYGEWRSMLAMFTTDCGRDRGIDPRTR